MLRVLITRPREEAEKLVPLVRARGFEPILNPLLAVAAFNTSQPGGPFSHLVFTSAQAARLMPEESDKILPVYCVGEQTAVAAREAGFVNIIWVAPSVPPLLPVLQKLPKGSALLYPCGRHTAHDLKELLAPHGIAVAAWPLYETKFLPLQGETIHLLSSGEVQWILLFSERSAEALARALPQNHRDWSGKVGIAAISAAAARPVAALGWAEILCAREPTASGVLDCLR